MNIKFLVMDVDGSLTDGKIYMSNEGELCKAFDIKDGCGIKEILPKLGIIPIIITARKSELLEKRCIELGINELHQGCRNKLEKLDEIIKCYSKTSNYSLSNVCYFGDDLLDLQPMKKVQSCGGKVACPSNAIQEIKDIADFVSCYSCGDGALREYIDVLYQVEFGGLFDDVKKLSSPSYDFLKKYINENIKEGTYKLADGSIAKVMSYITRPLEFTSFESHRKYIDVQYLIYGKELMLIEDVNNLKDCVISQYDENKDIILYKYDQGKLKILDSRSVEILYPNDAHRGAIKFENPQKIKKIVLKIPYKK